MFSIITRTLIKLPTILPKCALINQSTAMFHTLLKQNMFNTNLSTSNVIKTELLQPITPVMIPNCGFKVKGRLKRRCKDCYFVMRQQRLYVICKTHPRHKQMSMVPKEKNTWILTHATQGKIRPW